MGAAKTDAGRADELLTVDQVAKVLQMNPDHVRRMIGAGLIREVRVGFGRRNIRLKRSALDEYITDGEVE